MSGRDHAFFILIAYGVSFALLAAEVFLLVRRSRRLRKERPDEA